MKKIFALLLIASLLLCAPRADGGTAFLDDGRTLHGRIVGVSKKAVLMVAGGETICIERQRIAYLVLSRDDPVLHDAGPFAADPPIDADEPTAPGAAAAREQAHAARERAVVAGALGVAPLEVGAGDRARGRGELAATGGLEAVAARQFEQGRAAYDRAGAAASLRLRGTDEAERMAALALRERQEDRDRRILLLAREDRDRRIVVPARRERAEAPVLAASHARADAVRAAEEVLAVDEARRARVWAEKRRRAEEVAAALVAFEREEEARERALGALAGAEERADERAGLALRAHAAAERLARAPDEAEARAVRAALTPLLEPPGEPLRERTALVRALRARVEEVERPSIFAAEAARAAAAIEQDDAARELVARAETLAAALEERLATEADAVAAARGARVEALERAAEEAAVGDARSARAAALRAAGARTSEDARALARLEAAATTALRAASAGADRDADALDDAMRGGEGAPDSILAAFEAAQSPDLPFATPPGWTCAEEGRVLHFRSPGAAEIAVLTLDAPDLAPVAVAARAAERLRPEGAVELRPETPEIRLARERVLVRLSVVRRGRATFVVILAAPRAEAEALLPLYEWCVVGLR